MSQMDVSIFLKLVDQATAPLKGLGDNLAALARQSKAMQERMQLPDTAGMRFAALEKTLAATGKTLKTAQGATARLGKEMKASASPAKTLNERFTAARREARRLKEAHRGQAQALERLRRELAGAGQASRRMAGDQDMLARSGRGALETLRRQSEAVRKMQQAMKPAQAMRAAVPALAAPSPALANAGNLALVGQGAARLRHSLAHGGQRLLEPYRGEEEARGALATLGMDNLNAIVAAGRDLQSQIPGITSSSYLQAAYDIKSGISTLSDEGVAAMTKAAAITARATRAHVTEMSELFAVAHGTYKRQFADLTDGAFGDLFSGTLAKAVQQFKTTGSGMRQAMVSAGAGATNLGSTLAEQIATLGMLQQTMKPEGAGTSLAAFARSAGKAQEAFDKLAGSARNPVAVRVLDEGGMLRALPDILRDLEYRYGDVLDASEKLEIQQAFGSEEAVRLIDTLWGQREALAANTTAMRSAGGAGLEVARSMATLRADNFNDQMVQLRQNIDLAKTVFAEALAPEIAAQAPGLAKFAEQMGRLAKEFPTLTQWTARAAIGIGALAAVIEPIAGTIVVLAGSFLALRKLWKWLGISKMGAGLFNLAQKAKPLMAFKSAFRGITGAARGLGGLLLRLPALFGPALAGARALGAVIGPKLVAALPLAKSALFAVAGAIKAIGVALIANPIGAAIAGIAVGAVLIWQHWDWLKQKLAPLWETLKSGFSGLADWFANFDFAEKLQGIWDKIRGILDWSPLEAVRAAWQPLADWFAGLPLAKAIGEEWGKMDSILKYTPLGVAVAAWQPLADWFAKLDFAGRLQGIWDKIKGILDWSPLEAVRAAWQPLLNWLEATFGGLFEKIETLRAAIPALPDLDGALDGALGKARATGAAIADAMGGAAGSAGNALKQWTDEAFAFLSGAAERARMAGDTVRQIAGPTVVAGALAAAPTAASAASPSPPQITDNRHIEIHVTAQPGEDIEALAERVAGQIERDENNALYDID